MSRMRINDEEIKEADIFRILLDNFPDMIHSIDPEGNIVYTNRTAEALLGYSKKELLGMNISDVYAEEVLDDLTHGFSDLRQKGDKSVESILKAKDGTRIPVEIRSFSIYDDNGIFIRTFSILRDIRKVKELQQGLIHASRLAAIGEMASGVAHDIKNPLTVIVLSNDAILKMLKDPGAPLPLDRLQTFTDAIQKASKSIHNLSEHLRDFSRGIAEKHETVDLYQPITDALFIVGNKLDENNVTVENRVRKHAHFIRGLPNQMEQVFVNLIGNAADAMSESPRKRLSLEVVSDRRDDTDYWRCDVSDTGPGIPEDVRHRIFDSFFTTKRKGLGTGLGLSITRGIVREHQGEIDIVSEEGKGTTFSVYLPKEATDHR